MEYVIASQVRLLQEGENRGGSSGVNKLISTIVPLLIISIPIVLAFFFLRNKHNRVYAPRSFLDVLKDESVTAAGEFEVRQLTILQGEDTKTGVWHVQLDLSFSETA